MQDFIRLILCVFLGLSISCKDKTIAIEATDQKTSQVDNTPLEKNVSIDETFKLNFDTVLLSNVKDSLNTWQSFFDYQQFVQNEYSDGTLRHALEVSLELNDYVSAMKNDLKHPYLRKDLGIQSRIRVLDAEVKRLLDMSKIKAIGAKEVSRQLKKIENINRGFVQHINFIFQQKAFEQTLVLDTLFAVDVVKQNRKKMSPAKKSKKLRIFEK